MTILTSKISVRIIRPTWLWRKWIAFLELILVVLAVLLVLNQFFFRQSQTLSSSAEIASAPIVTGTAIKTDTKESHEVKVGVPRVISALSISKAEQKAQIEPEKIEHVQEMIEWLFQTVSSADKIYPEDVKDIYQFMQQIAAEGNAAVPAIRHFLETQKNFVFDGVQEANFTDYRSLRIAFIEALGNIGGPEAEAVLVEVLEATTDPAEVAMASRILERQVPDYYRRPILNATRRVLADVAQGAVPDEISSPRHSTDAAPLFKLLRQFPDETVAAELERVLPWYEKYAPVTLGNLSDGKGVSTLIRMSQNFTVPHNEKDRLVLHMLAQVAVDNPDAGKALLAKVRADEIPDEIWQRVAEVVGGDYQLQIEPPGTSSEGIASSWGQNVYSTQTVVGNQIQTIYSVHRSAVLSPEECEHRSALLEQMAAETSNPVALQAINDALSLLLNQ